MTALTILIALLAIANAQTPQTQDDFENQMTTDASDSATEAVTENYLQQDLPVSKGRCGEWSDWADLKCWWPDQKYEDLPHECTDISLPSKIPDYIQKFVELKQKELYSALQDSYQRRGQPPRCGHCTHSFKCRSRNATQEDSETDNRRRKHHFCKTREIKSTRADCDDSKACHVSLTFGACLPPLFLHKKRERINELIDSGEHEDAVFELFDLLDPVADSDSADEFETNDNIPEGEQDPNQSPFFDLPYLGNVQRDEPYINAYVSDDQMAPTNEEQNTYGNNFDNNDYQRFRARPSAFGLRFRRQAPRGYRPFPPRFRQYNEQNEQMNNFQFVPRDQDNFENSDNFNEGYNNQFQYEQKQDRRGKTTHKGTRGGNKKKSRGRGASDKIEKLLKGTMCVSTGEECLCCCGGYIPDVETGECKSFKSQFPKLDAILLRGEPVTGDMTSTAMYDEHDTARTIQSTPFTTSTPFE